jgi:hypothetical protein
VPTKQAKYCQYEKVAVNLLYAGLETTGHRHISPACIDETVDIPNTASLGERNKQALKVQRPDRVVLEVCLDLLSVNLASGLHHRITFR